MPTPAACEFPGLRAGLPPRVVLDNALVLAALVFGGGEGARLRRAWQLGYCRPLLCKATLCELEARLAHPQIGLSAAERQQLLGDFLPHALKVRVADADAGVDTPTGLTLARLAMAGHAHALVSADAELLGQPLALACPVMALTPFLEALRGADIQPLALRRIRRPLPTPS